MVPFLMQDRTPPLVPVRSNWLLLTELLSFKNYFTYPCKTISASHNCCRRHSFFFKTVRLDFSCESSADSQEMSGFSFSKKTNKKKKTSSSASSIKTIHAFINEQLTFCTRWANSVDDILIIFFPRKQVLTFHAVRLKTRQFACNVKTEFLENIRKYFKMSVESFTQHATDSYTNRML